MIKIIIDDYIPYIKGALDDVADVKYVDYKHITSGIVANADALIVRTRTRCNETLLQNAKVRFIASATIGYDHIDAAFCAKKNIKWTNAPACNALSVAQYIASALMFLAKKNQFLLEEKTIGIVGVGAVGSKIEKLAKHLGMSVLLCDPPRERREKNEKFMSLEKICQEADIITFHTPLNISGEDKTLYLADNEFFTKLQKRPIIINAARGEIVQTDALIAAIEKKQVSDVVLDCWENEPEINRKLLKLSILATPHIAGYSADGKANAAMQSLRAVSRFFDLGKNDWQIDELPKPLNINLLKQKSAEDFYLQTYDIAADSATLKQSPENFENQRSHYPFRREPKAYFGQIDNNFAKKLGNFWQE